MRMLLSGLVCSCILFACNNSTDTATVGSAPDSTKATTPPQAEFADAKYVDLGKAALAKFEAGDIDGWLSAYDDNAVNIWSNGDSLAGKQAIATYWKDRRANVIDSLKLSNDIWFPIKINTPQRGPDMPGVWLLCWHQVDVKYKNGKKLTFWVHNDYHYNSNDKIDRAIQYIDFAPIKAATAK